MTNAKLPKNCEGKKLNSPFQSNRKNKKLQVCVRDKKGKIKNIHFGDKRYEDYTQHGNRERRKNFRSRHNCDPVSKLNKATPRYWSCQKLW